MGSHAEAKWPCPPVWHWTGPVYGVAAVALGAAFLYEVHRLYRASRRQASGEDKLVTMGLFHLSLVYLTLLFTAVAVGALMR